MSTGDGIAGKDEREARNEARDRWEWRRAPKYIRPIAEAMAAYAATRGKQPTHLYLTPDYFKNLTWALASANEILGMRLVICDPPLPMGKKDFFVTA